jgi:hypothetical protein
MSQITTFTPTIKPGSGPVFTLTGNAGGAASPDGLGNINVIGSGSITVNKTASSTLTISSTLTQGIVTIDGDVGSVTGSTVSIISGTTYCGSTTQFFGSGTTLQFVLTDPKENTVLGALSDVSASAGNNTGIGYNVFGTTLGTLNTYNNCAMGSNTLQSSTNQVNYNCCIGDDVLFSATSLIEENVGIGFAALYNVTTNVKRNTAIGTRSGYNLLTGNNNVLISSYNAGSAYTSNESNNICLQSSGVISDSYTLRIGDSTGSSSANQLNKVYICGINGNTLSGTPSMVTIDSSTNQLGVATIPSSSLVTYTPVAHAASPYTALTTDYYIGANVTGGVITIKFPDAPTTGRVFIIKDVVGLAATSNITVTTVTGTDTFDGSTSYVMNTAYEAAQFIFNGSSWEIF